MPQPLSRVLPKCTNIQFDADALQKYPQLATQIAVSIARWSTIEHRVGWLLIKMLGADAKPAYAMFSEIVSSALQVNVLKAAAKAALPEDDFRTFSIVTKVIVSQAKQRNKFAHGLWGISSQIEDGLLLTDSEHIFKTEIELAQYKKNPSEWFKATGFDEAALERLLLFDHSQIFVYRDSDFKCVIRDFTEASQIVFWFGLTIDPDEKSQRDDILQSLSKLRLFREASDQLHERLKKNP
jgi:hypothetical protein